MKKTLLFLVLATLSATGFTQSESALQVARKHYQEDNYVEAIRALEKAAIEEPSNAQVPYLTGRAYLDMNNYRKAASYLEKAIAMDSTKANWIYECGLIFYAIPDFKKSLQYILLAGEKGYKRTNDYLENLGNAYLNVKDYPKGLELLGEVLKKKPGDPELLYQVAFAYYKSGKFQEAIDHWDQVLEIDQTNAEALYMIGMAYQKKGEKDKGQQICDRAIEMDPSLRSKRQRMGGDF
jgi:tetratricopeptide (TPR) repeat protein